MATVLLLFYEPDFKKLAIQLWAVVPFLHFSSVSEGTSAAALTAADELIVVVAADEHDEPLPKLGFLGSG